MKTTLVIFLLFLSFSSQAQTVALDSAKNYIGKEITVCGQVQGTYIGKSDNTVFLNFGHDYPNQVFSVIIFSDDAKKFADNPATLFKEKNVCVTGTVKEYKGKVEIVVTKVEQLRLQ